MFSAVEEQDIAYYAPGQGAPLYHQVQPLTVLLLSIVTLSLYSYWWHYRNWRCVQRNAEQTISPLFRAIFHPLYAFSLYNMVGETASNMHIKGVALLGALGFIRLVSFFYHLPDFPMLDGPAVGYFDIFFTMFLWMSVDMVYVQLVVNKVNQRLGLRRGKSR
jgi:hypothetical protein